MCWHIYQMLSKPARHINNSESHKRDPAETASKNHTKNHILLKRKGLQQASIFFTFNCFLYSGILLNSKLLSAVC